MNYRLLTGILLLSTILFTGMAVADETEIPPLPAQYYGTASIDGKAAPVGTIILAQIENETVGTVTLTEPGKIGSPGTFGAKLLIAPSSSDTEGKRVSFKTGTFFARETIEFSRGDYRDISLNFSSGTSSDNTVADGTWNAAVAAKITCTESPVSLQTLIAPNITNKVGATLRLTKVSAEIQYANGTTAPLVIEVNPADGKLIFAPLPADVSSIQVTFQGRPLGDVTGSGNPNMLDAITIAQHSVGNLEMDEVQLFYGAVTGYGNPSMLDAITIAQRSVQNLNDFYQ